MQFPSAESIPLPGGVAHIEWRRSKRARRVSLRIDPCGGSVVVTLPMRAGRGAGVALLMSNAEWVSDHLAALPAPIPFVDGAIVPVDGKPHRIRHMPGTRRGAWIEAGELRVSGTPEFLRRRVTDLLRREAKHRLAVLVMAKAEILGLTPRRLSVKDTRSRWGSCASDGSLSFCWRLVMAPAFVQDYVVAHEVAHLRHMNHGKRFWALVNRLTPHTDLAIAWLNADGSRLLRIG